MTVDEGHYYIIYFLFVMTCGKEVCGSGKAWKAQGIFSPTLWPPCALHWDFL